MEKNQSKELRLAHKKLRDNMSAEEHSLKSADISGNVLALLESDFKGANIFLCFYPFGSEVNLMPLYERLIESGKALYFPKSNIDNHELTFYRISHIRSDFHKGAYGIMEPNDTLPIFEYKAHKNERIICITPGLIFDKHLNRIGYGAGFYDRFLCDKSNIIKIAPCFAHQIIDKIFSKPHDVCMDVLVSEKGIEAIGGEYNDIN